MLLPASLPLALEPALAPADAVRWRPRIPLFLPLSPPFLRLPPSLPLAVLFPITGRQSAAEYRYPLPTYLRATTFSILPLFLRSPSTRVFARIHSFRSISLLFSPSKCYFSSATNAKLKRISPILSVNMPLLLEPSRGQSFSSASACPTTHPRQLRHSPPLLQPTAIIRTRRSANGYRGWARTVATGTTGCFTFPRETASKLERRCTCAHLAAATLMSRACTCRQHVCPGSPRPGAIR